VLVASAVIAIIALAASRKSPPPSAEDRPLADKPAPESPKPKAKTVEPKSKEEPPPPITTPLGDLAIDKDTQLKTLLHDLEQGKTCTDRKGAIPGLVTLGDERAIKPLRAARYRMRGGVLGFRQSNTNACLKADAEAAIKALGGKLK